MGFLNAGLLLGMLGISVPILIHLLNRFRFRRIDWAAMELLRRAVLTRSRQIRLEDLLLLILRCAVILLLALSLARPTITASGAKWFGGEARIGAVIAIDASYSMAHRPGQRSRFDHALQIVEVVESTLEPGDTISLVLMGQKSHILLRNVTYNEGRFKEALAEAAPLPEGLNLDVCLDELAELVREMKAPVRECYCITDAQTVTWRELSDPARLSLEAIDQAATAFFVPTGVGGVENLALTSFARTSGALRKGSLARFVAEIRNCGARPQDAAVILYAGNEAVDQRSVSAIRPGTTRAVDLYARFQEVGSVTLRARLARRAGAERDTFDALAVDNARHAVAHVPEEVRILCVDGDASDRPEESETHFLKRALAPWRYLSAEVLPSALSVDVVPYLELGTKAIEAYDLVVLANVRDIRTAHIEAIAQLVEEGGALVIFLGDTVDAGLLNGRLKREETSLLPAELGAVVTAPGEEGFALEIADRGHPLAKAISSLPAELLNQARVKKLVQATPVPGARVILKVGGTGAPLLLEREIGFGRVVLMTSTADRAWTNLPAHPIFPILVHETITLATRRPFERQFMVNEPLVAVIPGQIPDTSAAFRDPEGQESSVRVTQKETMRVAELSRQTAPGFYEVVLASVGNPIRLAVNVDTRESDVMNLSGVELQAALSGLPLTIRSEDQDLAAVIRESRVGREFWRVLMLLALAVFAVEGMLARRFSRRMRGVKGPAPRGTGRYRSETESSNHAQQTLGT